MSETQVTEKLDKISVFGPDYGDDDNKRHIGQEINSRLWHD